MGRSRKRGACVLAAVALAISACSSGGPAGMPDDEPPVAGDGSGETGSSAGRDSGLNKPSKGLFDNKDGGDVVSFKDSGTSDSVEAGSGGTGGNVSPGPSGGTGGLADAGNDTPDPCADVSCDDGNPCTEDSCKYGRCTNEPLDETSCPDGTCRDGSCCTGCWNASESECESGRNWEPMTAKLKCGSGGIRCYDCSARDECRDGVETGTDCYGTLAPAGGQCFNSICTECGGADQPCCQIDMCGEECGDPDTCCQTEECSGEWLLCDVHVCIPCGDLSQPCCEEQQCDHGYACNDATNTCH